MNLLAQTIRDHGVDGLQEVIYTKNDSTLYTIKQLALVLTPEELGIVATVLKQASDADPQVWLFVQSFTSTGLAFNSPLTQYMISTLFASFPSLRTKLSEIGIISKKRWETLFDVEPTQEEIVIAQSQVAAVDLVENIQQLRDQGLSLEEVKVQIQALIG